MSIRFINYKNKVLETTSEITLFPIQISDVVSGVVSDVFYVVSKTCFFKFINLIFMKNSSCYYF